MADEQKKPEGADPKKLVMAIIATLEHRHGRPPTAEEISRALVDEPKETQELDKADAEMQAADEPPEPKVFSFMIHYGMKTGQDGTRAEDPTNPLYYGDEARNRWFDVHKGQWETQKPHIVDSLPCRRLGDSDSQKDLFDAIINGVMDQEDYELLSKDHDLLDPRCHKAYKLVNQLTADTEALNKALAKSEEADEEFEPITSSDEPSSVEASQDVLSDIMEGAGVASSDRGDGSPEAAEGQAGEDLTQEIKEAVLSPGVEYRVRRLIQDEISKALDMIRQEIYSALNAGSSEVAETIDPEGVDMSEQEPLDL